MRSLFVLLLLASCADETISGYADPRAVYALREIDGAAFAATATIAFAEPGRAAGDAPCNRWSAAQTAPYPWFELSPIAATRRACPDLDAESAFFAALGEMTIAEVSGDTLILSNDAGREMVFQTSR